MRVPELLCVFSLVFSAVPTGAAAQEAPRHFPRPDELAALIQRRIDHRQAVGMVLGVVKADGTVSIVAAGDPGPEVPPLSEASVFEIGSITKVLTGSLLAEMARTGEVALDDPVSRYLPEGVRVPSRGGREITLLDLATHHSGLPAVPLNMTPADPSNPYADYSVDQLHAFLEEFELPRDPGAAYQYSNVGFGLLGHALARAAGTGYEELVRERILEPLGMDQTGIALRGHVRQHIVKGHNWRGRMVPYWDLPTLAGAGAFRSSMRDMMRLLVANLGEPRTGLERAMRVTHEKRRAVSDTTAMGIGWQIRSVGESQILWKDGGTAGFQTFIGFDSERGIGVVVLANAAIEVDDIGFHLLHPEVPLSPPPPMPREVEIPASVLEEYVGEYSLTPELSASVTLEDGRLFLQPNGERKLRLLASSESEFFFDEMNAWIVFVRDTTGVVTGHVLRQSGGETHVPKVR